MLALKCRSHVVGHALTRSWHSVRVVLLLNDITFSAKSLLLASQYDGRSFTKMRGNTGPYFAPCGIPDATGVRADSYVLLLDNFLTLI